MRVFTESEEIEIAKAGDIITTNILKLLSHSGVTVAKESELLKLLIAISREMARMGFCFGSELNKSYNLLNKELLLIRQVRSGYDPKVFVDFIKDYLRNQSEEDRKSFLEAIKEL